MRTGKSALILFIFLVITVPIGWFTVIFPYQSAASFFKNIPKWIDSTLTKQFPVDLVISVKNGQVTLNRTSPYCLILKEGSQIGIVFDTRLDPQIKAFDTDGPYSRLCQPLFVIGKNYVMSLDNNNISIHPIPAQATFSIDQKNLSKLVSDYLPKLVASGKNLYLYAPFILILPVFIFILLNNYWYSLVSRLVLKIFKIRPGIKSSEVYGVSLFFYTCILFIQWVFISYILNHLSKLTVNLSFPFMNTILIAIACLIYFKKIPTTPSPPEAPSTDIKFKTVT